MGCGNEEENVKVQSASLGLCVLRFTHGPCTSSLITARWLRPAAAF
jgi:hypothetical protein